jgi:hypothetical protein
VPYSNPEEKDQEITAEIDGDGKMDSISEEPTSNVDFDGDANAKKFSGRQSKSDFRFIKFPEKTGLTLRHFA